MTKLTVSEIQELGTRLSRRCPELHSEIKNLIAQAIGNRQVQHVEVTHSDGRKEVMPAEAYQRLTATDLAHSALRILPSKE